MPAISDYAKPSSASGNVPDDIYEAEIIAADVEKDDQGVVREDQYGKKRLLVRFELLGEEGPDGGPITLRRSFAISYGAMGGQYAALATMIAAAMGMHPGDKAIHHVTTEQLIGKRVRVQTTTVQKGDRTYTNVANVMPPPKARSAQTQTRTVSEAVTRAQQYADEAPLDESEIPF